MKLIQETPDFVIYRDQYLLSEVRFVRIRATGECRIFAEDLARILGYHDVHEMLGSDEVLDKINFAHLESGIYPVQTLSIPEADGLMAGLDETPLEKAEYFEEHYGEYEPRDPDLELAEALEMLVSDSANIVAANAIPCEVTHTCGTEVNKSREFALELKCDTSGSIVLTKDDMKTMLNILNVYQPAQNG
jgi:hypothetical protein